MKNRNKNFDAELAAVAQKRDEDIDTSDIPEVKDWSRAVVGRFYRPVKEAVSIRLDAEGGTPADLQSAVANNPMLVNQGNLGVRKQAIGAAAVGIVRRLLGRLGRSELRS